MRTLVGEGIVAFIIVGREHPLVGLEVFFLLGIFLRRILQDPLLMGIPLDSAKRGEKVIYLYTRYVGGKQTLVSTVSS